MSNFPHREHPFSAESLAMCLAVPGQVESLFKDNRIPMGKVNFGGVVKTVCLAYMPEIEVGDYVIVHVGFAISKIDEQSALKTLRSFEELGMLELGLQELRETEFGDSGQVAASCLGETLEKSELPGLDQSQSATEPMQQAKP